MKPLFIYNFLIVLEEHTMNQFTEWMLHIYDSYGFKAIIVIVLTIVITNLIKRPILKKAETYALKYNCDKSVITKWIALIPYGVAFTLNLIFVIVLAAVHHNWDISWRVYISDSALFATLSVAGFEIGKKCLESYVARNQGK